MGRTQGATENELAGEMSVNKIRTLGKTVREKAGIKDGTDSFSTCHETCKTLLNELSDHDIEAWLLEAHMGEERETHYCLYLPIGAVTDIPGKDGGVVVDPTLDQFCTENARAGKTDVDFGPCESLPAVAIYPPGAEERTVSYFRPKTPRGIYRHFPYDRN